MFAQFSLPTLGLIAGCGVVSPDPAKRVTIDLWPRPSRLEDVEKFLATTVFLRPHLSPRYSEISRPLRDVLKPLHDKRAAGKQRREPRKQPPEAGA